MTKALSSELFKLRTTRSFYWLNGSLLAAVLAVALITCAFPDYGAGEGPLEGMQWALGSLVQAVALLLGALVVTTEFRHGTITPTLLVVPNRVRLMAAKLAAALLTGALLGLLATGLVVGLVALFGSLRDFDTTDAKLQILIGGTLNTALFAGLGVGVGALVRNQVGAIVGSLLYLFVGETILSVLLGLSDSTDDIIPRYGLGALSNSLGHVNPFDDDLLAQVPGGLLLALYVAILLVAGTLLMRRRDVTA